MLLYRNEDSFGAVNAIKQAIVHLEKIS